MLSSMDDHTLESIVGPGIKDLFIQWFPFRDHKRQEAAERANNPFPDESLVPIWDFVAMRIDGTGVRFHPSLHDDLIEYCDAHHTSPTTARDAMGPYQTMLKATYTNEGKYAEATKVPSQTSSSGGFQSAASSGSAVAEGGGSQSA